MTTDQQRLILAVRGMHCGSCAAKIQAALLGVGGVTDTIVSHQAGTAQITGNQRIGRPSLSAAVESAGDYTVTSVVERPPENGDRAAPMTSEPSPAESLYPLYLIAGFIAGVTFLVAYASGIWEVEPIMRRFMAGFFLVFSFFKLLDLSGFVSAYRGYDLIARKVPAWGWAYPFVELTLGVAYLLAWWPVVTNTVTLILMLIGAAGVLKALLDKRAIRCACLGTALNLPMTKVTLVEDLTMAAMAAAMMVLLQAS